MHIPSTAHTSTWCSPLGPMVLATHDAGLLGLWFEGQKHQPALHGCLPPRPGTAALAIAQAACQQLADYFAGRLQAFDLPLDVSGGTAFQQSVWLALGRIAPGQTLSYSALSTALGRPSAARAVAAAVGRNPCSIVLPCHRVVGRNGALTGYAGGLERKAALLALERSFTPTPTESPV